MQDRLVIGGQLGDYLIESVIGRGGMSVVYRARHSRLEMLVALKVLAPELSAGDSFRERFLREAQMAASMDHPNVIPIHDMGLHEDSLYIILRYVSGGDLKALLSTAGPLELTRALSLLTPAGAALDAAHARGLIHRDVKPANILIQRPDGGGDEHVYLTDFGVAKSASFDVGLTRSGVSVGTLGYMAPEQLEGKGVSPQTDVYALAATLYECLVGRVPFRQQLAEGSRPRTDDLQPVSALRSDLPSTLDAVLRKGLAQDPDARPRSCNEFLRSCWVTLGDSVAPASAAAEPTPVLTRASTDVHETGSSELPPAAPASVSSAPRAEAEPPTAGSGDERAPKSDSAGSRRKALVGGGALLVAGGVAVGAALLASGSTRAGRSSAATLGQVPTNHVTGHGNATISLKGNEAAVTVDTEGLDRGAPLVHLMHIHAGGKDECPPASAARLHNGHLAISTTNGASYYGPPVQALTTHGDTSAASIIAFPRYLSGGTLRYQRSIDLPAAVAADIRQGRAVIVVHGVDYDGSGIYSGVLGLSELNRSVPGTATAPALCGRLAGAPSNVASSMRSRGRALLYAASLELTSVPASEAFLCGAYAGAAGPAAAQRRSSAGLHPSPSA